MTRGAVNKTLKLMCEAAGSQKALSTKTGISQQHISDVIRGAKAPGPKMCAAMKIIPVVTYRRTRPGENPWIVVVRQSAAKSLNGNPLST